MLYTHISLSCHSYNNTPPQYVIMHNTFLFSNFNGQTLITEKPESINNLYYWLTVT